MAALPVETIQGHIRQLGLSNNKARFLKAMAAQLLERHGGEVPSDAAQLEALAGVGHKTASVVRSQAFGIPAFAVDTHVHRLAVRWGLAPIGCTVEAAEKHLMLAFPQQHWSTLHVQFILFGREHCPAVKNHDFAKCPVCSFAADVEALSQPTPAKKERPAAADGAQPKKRAKKAAAVVKE
jgi:endonuclease III